MWSSVIGGLVMLILSLLAVPLAAEAQRQTKVYRIGQLHAGSPSTSQPHIDAFRQGLRALGYLEGQNILLEYRFADWQFEQLPTLATELIQRPVDILVTDGSMTTLAAKRVTQTIPIVMAASGSPVESGLVDSLARPGGNVTGLAFQAQVLQGKRLELLQEVVPGITRVASLGLHSTPPGAGLSQETERGARASGPRGGIVGFQVHMLQETERGARALGVQLQSLEVRGPEEFDRAFAAMAQEHAEAFMTMPSAMFWAHRTQIVALATTHRLPGIFPEREFAEAGGLMSYGPSVAASFHRAATYVDKILKGTKPADMPIEQPMKFELVLNLKTAQALGITIPAHLLLLADEVIK